MANALETAERIKKEIETWKDVEFRLIQLNGEDYDTTPIKARIEMLESLLQI